ncbi:MAG: hypothetical protein ACYS91_17080, partial [Planctomycetota bacterium]
SNHWPDFSTSLRFARNDKIIDDFSVFSVSSVAQKISEISEICGGILLNTLCSTIVENSLQINLFMQNKAKVNIGKMNISIAIIKDYDKKTKNQQRMLLKTKPNKAKVNIGKIGTEWQMQS